MAGFHVEQAICRGRGFNAPSGPTAGGLLYYILQFLPKALVSGGPGWYTIDDQSALGTDPYVVFSDKNAAGPYVPAKYVKVLIPTATSGQIRVFYYLYWDTVSHTGLGIYGAHNVPTLDAADFIYDLRGGPECMIIQTFTSTVWDASWIDEINLDPNLIDSVAATTAVSNFTAADLQLRGIDLLAGTMANGLDTNGNMYGSIVLVSAGTWRVDLYNNAAKGAGDLIWRSSNFSTLVAAANITNVTGTAQNGSGVTYKVFLQGPTVADATIVFRMNKITVGSGEGAQFTAGNYYVIYNLLDRNCINIFNVISKSGDVLTIDRVYRPFKLGSKIGSYPHNYCVAGTQNTLMNARAALPYSNVLGTMANQDVVGGSGVCEQKAAYTDAQAISDWSSGINFSPEASLSSDDNYMNAMSPDRKGRWAVQRPGVIEYRTFGQQSNLGRNGVTGYGQLKNAIIGSSSGMSPNIHGRKLSGIDYTYFRLVSAYFANPQTGTWAVLFRETQSDT